jgi:hypothetical protein
MVFRIVSSTIDVLGDLDHEPGRVEIEGLQRPRTRGTTRRSVSSVVERLTATLRG